MRLLDLKGIIQKQHITKMSSPAGQYRSVGQISDSILPLLT